MPYVNISYAQSSRCICKGCYKFIVVKGIKIGYTTSDRVGQAKIAWFHEDCFNRTNLWGLKDLETVEMDQLSWEDQNRLREKLKKLMNTKNPAKK